ncbi:toll/interleukin-1 receptor domain-containing protein [Actinoplanes sp. NPDC051470]|uniref:toll/interleukin-1 receptor domain-containing protein n=1 Tax=unclassified Actinoplanes TaxID=2626549 RepID=UPI003412ADD0
MTDMTADDDPGAPVFFLSYSRPDRSRSVGPPREPNRNVIKLFDELNELVNELIGSPVGGDPGYLDLGRGGGELWQKGVLQAAGTCQVLVCLISHPYLFQSTWCPREWDIFTRRAVVPRGRPAPGIESAIIPVLWTPLEGQLPPPIAAVNLFVPAGLPDEDHTARYLADGLLGLARTGQTAIYEAIVWKLALHIQRVHSRYRVEPGIPDGIDDLRTSFMEGAP